MDMIGILLSNFLMLTILPFDANNIFVRYDSRNVAFLGRKRGDLVGIDLMLIAYDEDLNRNMYWLANPAVA